MSFFKSLLSADGDVSSKRFAGLSLVGLFIVGTIVEASTGGMGEGVESLLKTSLYTGSGLLGVNIAETMLKTIKRNGDK